MKTGRITSQRTTSKRATSHLVGLGLALFLFWNSGAFAASPSSQSESPRLSANAKQQIQAILLDKAQASPAQAKLDTRLWLEIRQREGDESLRALPIFSTGVEVDGSGQILVDVQGRMTPELLDSVQIVGGEIESAFPKWNTARVRLPFDAIEELATRSEITSIRVASQMMVHGNTVISEGDVAHRADIGRTSFAVDGSGVTACAMSDSVDELATLQASGELPAGVVVLPGQSGNPGTSEGTALLEIIHDLAPGASLVFATGQGGAAQMAQNILDLAAAGCDTISDDVFYFNEPPFQDGIIAQAVDQVAQDSNVLYFSSAGNSGRLNAGTAGVWEGLYNGVALPAPLVGAGQSAHDFGSGLAGNQVTEDALNDAPFFTLWWSDPLGGAGNDYDLFLLDDALQNVVAFSTSTQNGDDDPFEIINSVGLNHSGNRLVVVKFSGDDRFLQVNTHRGQLEEGTNGQITGHAAAEGAFAVAAVGVASAGGGPFIGGATNPAEPFSSDGPRRIFFNPDGSPVTTEQGSIQRLGPQTSVVRQKPDFAAADGVQTTSSNFTTFFGTSASVPHAGAISALVRDLNGELTPEQFEALLNSSVLDIESAGFDFDSGRGILDGNNALENTNSIFADGFESGDTTAWTN